MNNFLKLLVVISIPVAVWKISRQRGSQDENPQKVAPRSDYNLFI